MSRIKALPEALVDLSVDTVDFDLKEEVCIRFSSRARIEQQVQDDLQKI